MKNHDPGRGRSKKSTTRHLRQAYSDIKRESSERHSKLTSLGRLKSRDVVRKPGRYGLSDTPVSTIGPHDPPAVNAGAWTIFKPQVSLTPDSDTYGRAWFP